MERRVRWFPQPARWAAQLGAVWPTGADMERRNETEREVERKREG